MVIDGKKIANEIKTALKAEVLKRTAPPGLFIFTVGENSISEKFLAVKKKFADDIGVVIEMRRFPESIDATQLAEEIERVTREDNVGIIVQLPLPSAIDTRHVLNAIPPARDVDVLSEKSFELFKEGTLPILPPVVEAIKEILFRHNVFVGNKNVVIVGRGKLVGEPSAVWFKRHQSKVHIIDEHTLDASRYLLNADVIISGAGVPGLITPEMIKDGVVLLDAGTSEAGGKIVGDADPRCARKASVFTPVPGGIGPITVAMLFKNLLILTEQQK